MLDWERLDPKRTERGIQLLLHDLYGVDLTSFDSDVFGWFGLPPRLGAS